MNERETVEEKAEGSLLPWRAREFWRHYSSWIVVALMVIWVFLLIIGTIAEVFHIEKILSWAIWRPPGAMQ
jgi:hypothetical protein